MIVRTSAPPSARASAHAVTHSWSAYPAGTTRSQTPRGAGAAVTGIGRQATRYRRPSAAARPLCRWCQSDRIGTTAPSDDRSSVPVTPSASATAPVSPVRTAAQKRVSAGTAVDGHDSEASGPGVAVSQ
ncbi:hypothetical protein DI270_034540 [Microbispora triticiradicis]|uniref:Uncharacterized protein n=1 Tax=Microbispora triticiradicis TaxID=2200763 RepID=A0ABX9L949_9ACTN|nr:hypothetical protein DI270_034540 [Microbispora triticiradicis]